MLALHAVPASAEHLAALQPLPANNNNAEVRQFVDLLEGHPESGSLWVGGGVPEPNEEKRGARSACNTGVVVGGEHDYEEYCPQYWSRLATAANGRPSMYSVGLGGSYIRETFFSGSPRNASIHAYDPSTTLAPWHRTNAPSNVYFHFAGLGKGDGTDTGASSAGIYGKIADTAPMLSLSQMFSLNSDSGRGPGFLTVDCEGCEWDSFEQIERETPGALDDTVLLTLELHVTPALRAPGPGQFAAFFRFLFSKGFKVWYLHENRGVPSERGVVQELAAAGLTSDSPAYELGLVKTPA